MKWNRQLRHKPKTPELLTDFFITLPKICRGEKTTSSVNGVAKLGVHFSPQRQSSPNEQKTLL